MYKGLLTPRGKKGERGKKERRKHFPTYPLKVERKKNIYLSAINGKNRIHIEDRKGTEKKNCKEVCTYARKGRIVRVLSMTGNLVKNPF